MTRNHPSVPRAARAPFRTAPLPSRIAQEGALAALRMIEGQRWYARLIHRGEVRDADILELIGLERVDRFDDVTIADLRTAVILQRRRLESRQRKGADVLGRNVALLGEALRLSPAECSVLRLAIVATRIGTFRDLLRLCITNVADINGAVRDACRLSVVQVRHALAEEGMLRRAGFFEDASWPSFSGGNPLEVDSRTVDALHATRFDATRFLRQLIRQVPASSLSLNDFSHVDQVPLIERYLGHALARRRRGVNVLIYGAPGTGKTEFVRALAPVLGAQLHEVPNVGRDGEPLSGQPRFSAYSVCQNLLAEGKRQLLLFDEVEDVFGSTDRSDHSLGMMLGLHFRRDPKSLRKSWVNELLESNPVPAIWVCNSIDGIDPAFVRRFDLVTEFRVPTRAVRRRMIARHFKQGEISADCVDRLAGQEGLAPAQIERAARVARSLGQRDALCRDKEVEGILTSSLRAMGHRKPLASPALPAHYDPAFLNTDRDLDVVAAGLRGGAGARLCLYGAPGTGKTAFAHHLGRMLDRPVLVKRGSDLLGMYIGQSEQQIREAFEEARDEATILVIDEADSFLRDRKGAHRSWEVTLVNELLTQMETFEGIFVASTNLIDSLDEASLRRFDFKVRFDYLTRAQRLAMLMRVCGASAEQSVIAEDIVATLDRLEQLTPGDFANVLRQLRVTGTKATASEIVRLLAAEAAMKPEGRRRAIGFSAR